VNHRRHFDFDESLGGRESGDLRQRAGGPLLAERLPMSTRDVIGIRHVDNVDHRSHDMAHLRARFSKGRGDGLIAPVICT